MCTQAEQTLAAANQPIKFQPGLANHSRDKKQVLTTEIIVTKVHKYLSLNFILKFLDIQHAKKSICFFLILLRIYC